MAQSYPARENLSVFVPVKVPRRIFESYPPAVQRWIEDRIRHGEATLEGDGDG
jgi:hypothetical protein